MVIKSFRAATMEEALARVKATLGPSALIIETRKVAPRGPFGFLRKPLVEVVVGIEETPPTVQRRPRALVPIDWAAELANLRSVEAEIAEVRDALKLLTDAEPFDLAPLVRQLIQDLAAQGLDRHAATTIAQEAAAERQQAGGGEPRDHLRNVLARRFRVAPETEPTDQPQVLIVVGPPAAGKTTLVAKLAKRFALDRGERLALATTDFFRVGAAEQLGAYAEILGLPCHRLAGPGEVAELLETERVAQRLLVDTPGFARAQTERLERLGTWLDAFPRAERLLAIAADADIHAAVAQVEACRTLQFDRLAFTRLDEARRGGLLLAAAGAADVPVAYLGIGQDAADGLEVAQPARLAQLVLEPEAAAAGNPGRLPDERRMGLQAKARTTDNLPEGGR